MTEAPTFRSGHARSASRAWPALVRSELTLDAHALSSCLRQPSFDPPAPDSGSDARDRLQRMPISRRGIGPEEFKETLPQGAQWRRVNKVSNGLTGSRLDRALGQTREQIS